jgi:hypothetical protein
MADSPKQAEAAQAIFSAIADNLGVPFPANISNYTAFKKKYKGQFKQVQSKVDTPGVPFASIESFLINDNDWFKSSVNIANKLFDATQKLARKTYRKIKPKGIDLFYVRGDNDIFGGLDIIFKYTNISVIERNAVSAKKALVFNNINKWSPADIYLATQKAKTLISDIASKRKVKFQIGKGLVITELENFKDFSVLNAFLKELIDDGELLPLSLKKAPDAKTTIVKTINYVPGDVAKVLKEKNIGYHGYVFAKTNNVFNSKDIHIKFTTGAHTLQFRDKGSSGESSGKGPSYSYQGVIVGSKTALDGGLGGESIGDVITSTDSTLGKMFSLSNQRTIIDEAVKISKAMDKNVTRAVNNKICKTVFAYVNKYSQQRFKTKEELFKALNKEKGYTVKSLGSKALANRAKAQFIFSKYLGGSMIEMFEKNKKFANAIVINLILYAGSRAESSSPHFKAADISSF